MAFRGLKEKIASITSLLFKKDTKVDAVSAGTTGWFPIKKLHFDELNFVEYSEWYKSMI